MITPELYLIESDVLCGHCVPITGTGKSGPTLRPSPKLRSLLIDARGSLILLEAGLGLFDWLAPSRRLEKLACTGVVRRTRKHMVLRQKLERRGFSSDQVEHIVVTHTHSDNIGGITDFPSATVHALPSASTSELFLPSQRPRPQLAHGNPYSPPRGEPSKWHGFACHRLAIDTVELYLLELPGHTADHAGVLLRHESGYVLHLGHALLSLDELVAPVAPASAPQWLRLMRDALPFEAIVTRERLRSLARRPPMTLTFLSGRGEPPRLSVGPRPYPSIGFL